MCAEHLNDPTALLISVIDRSSTYIDPENDPANMWRPSPPLEGSHSPRKPTNKYEVKSDIWSLPDGSDDLEMSRSQAQSFVQQDWALARKQKSRLLTQSHRTAIPIPGPLDIADMETFTVIDAIQSEKNHKQETTNLKRKLKILMRATNPSNSDSQDPPMAQPQPQKKRRIVSPELGTSMMPDPSDNNTSKDNPIRLKNKSEEDVKNVHRSRSVRVEGPIMGQINSDDDQPFSLPPTNSKRQRITSQPSTHVTSRRKLANEWSSIAKAAGAAYITFTNDVDLEMVPKLSRDFQYIETGYHYTNNVPRVKDLEDSVFLRCECKHCTNPRQCECQLVSNLLDKDGEKRIAYNSKGRFVIDVTPSLLVIECNKYCGCDPSCPNRASQWPRTIPIDIFKTRDRGWGARPLRDVHKGTILGIYTGNLMRRSDAEGLEKAEREYCFDLDGQENPYEEDDSYCLQAYTVDARMCGNWTRFINHSCSPNLQVYQVVQNTIPEMNTPFIAFCAMENIPAKGELTVDYDPCASDDEKPRKKKKGKGKESVPAGSIWCKCGEDRCRQWVRVLN
ncbi:hypothetical protein APHAL10511_005209 [Amanita phalloides]|nr:hypothetical protein APHAL10511_005209 [Amanita phalloides]